MATGHLPFRAESLPELLGRMLQTMPTPPAARSGDVPAAASDAILRALAGDPNLRFAGARDLAIALG
jgi:serine/threonine protein kinase